LKEDKDESLAPAEALRRNLAYLCAGGKVGDAQLVKLLDAAKPENPMERHGVRVWASVLASFNEPSGLRLLLLYAKTDPELSARCLSDFEYLTGIADVEYDKKLEELEPAARGARVDRDLRWLAANQGKLSWDWTRRRFAGAAAPAEKAGPGKDPEAQPEPAPEAADKGKTPREQF
jgi:hypothetical protein